MSRTNLNFVLDVILAIALLIALWTAAVVVFIFPPGEQAAGWRLLGYSYGGWARISFVCLFIFGVLALLHVMLHWSWVCGVVANRLSKIKGRKIVVSDSYQTIIGVALLVAVLHVLGIAFLAAMLLVESPTTSANGARPVTGTVRIDQ